MAYMPRRDLPAGQAGLPAAGRNFERFFLEKSKIRGKKKSVETRFQQSDFNI